MSETPKRGTLPFTLATWIHALHTAGIPSADPGVQEACARIDAGEELEEAGDALVALLRSRLGDGHLEDAQALAAQLYGSATLATGLGESRQQALREARRYQFQRGLPWLACIVDRFPDGSVGPHWVLVEALDDQVTCLDPYPWDDLDETLTQPLVDFLVKWELGGLEGLRWVG